MDEVFARRDMITPARLKALSVKSDLRGAVRVYPGAGQAPDGLGGGQGVEPAQAGRAAGLRGEVADQAHPGQAAVGVGVEADGGDGAVVPASELVAGVGLQAGAFQQGRAGFGLAAERHLGGGVVPEVRGVDDDPAQAREFARSASVSCSSP